MRFFWNAPRSRDNVQVSAYASGAPTPQLTILMSLEDNRDTEFDTLHHALDHVNHDKERQVGNQSKSGDDVSCVERDNASQDHTPDPVIERQKIARAQRSSAPPPRQSKEVDTSAQMEEMQAQMQVLSAIFSTKRIVRTSSEEGSNLQGLYVSRFQFNA